MGTTAAVGHTKGMADLAELLRRPGRDVHVLDLVGSPARSGPAGDVLDRRSVGAYRQRLADLADEREAADAAADDVRLVRVEDEHDALVAELGRGTGMSGRSRAFGNHPAERARKAVTARLRDAVRRVAAVHPELAAHLDRTVVTGVRCRYSGEHAWRVDG